MYVLRAALTTDPFFPFHTLLPLRDLPARLFFWVCLSTDDGRVSTRISILTRSSSHHRLLHEVSTVNWVKNLRCAWPGAEPPRLVAKSRHHTRRRGRLQSATCAGASARAMSAQHATQLPMSEVGRHHRHNCAVAKCLPVPWARDHHARLPRIHRHENTSAPGGLPPNVPEARPIINYCGHFTRGGSPLPHRTRLDIGSQFSRLPVIVSMRQPYVSPRARSVIGPLLSSSRLWMRRIPRAATSLISPLFVRLVRPVGRLIAREGCEVSSPS